MSEPRQETRAEEVARVRSYLANQAHKRTPAQLVETLREAQRQFVEAALAVPEAAFNTPPKPGEWAAINILEHVLALAAFDLQAIGGALERGEPPKVNIEKFEAAPLNPDAKREDLLAQLAASREQLIAVVLKADPEARLDITWGHSEFGQMDWREWLLFARVHTLDHTQQMQALARELTINE